MTDLTRLCALADRGRELSWCRDRASRTDGRSAADWYRFVNATGERAELFIYDVIGDWGVSAGDFVAQLRGVTARHVDLHINSPGGLVFDGIAIHAALKNHPATVTSYVDGIAASAASFIAMAGDEVVVEKPAKLMIHDAAGLVIGNAVNMREMADLLDELSDTIAGIYADRAGGTVADWRAAMQRETWYSAADAVKAGLADRVNNDKAADKASGTTAPEDRRSQTIRARHRVRVTALGGVK